MIQIHNAVPRPDAGLGVVRAEGLGAGPLPPGAEAQLAALLAARRAPLSEAEEAVRRAARDVLRNGRYKPTGRGKPASEYLLRAAAEGAFPRVNAPVDAANLISLQTVLPVSLWDLDRAGTERFRFRLGRAGEAYVFNRAGQEIRLEDLVVGCGLGDEGAEVPLVNPVKDSQATKTTAATCRVAAVLYTPLEAVPAEVLAGHCAAFAALLAGCGPAVDTAFAVVQPGETKRV
ncbi:MAG: hypothetical protein R3247_04675 [Rhodothermales bacterium]|nr:hypothetical protein [Rhodothermales bacterium]